MDFKGKLEAILARHDELTDLLTHEQDTEKIIKLYEYVINNETLYNYLKDNFTIIHESEINMYNDNVYAIFEKYNQNNFKVGFIDCSQVIIYNHYNLDYVVSLDNGFRLFEEIELKDLSE